MFKILFICTDNIGRSLIAEYILKDWLRKNNRNDIEVSSAGTNADSDISSFCMAHLDRLKEMGIETAGHKRTQVTKELFENCDLAIVMEEEHRRWIEGQFDVKVCLYNEIYKNEKTDVRINPPGSQGTMEEKLIRMVEYFEESIVEMINNIDKITSKYTKK